MNKDFDFNLIPDVPKERSAIGIPFTEKDDALKAMEVAEAKGWNVSLVDNIYNYDEETDTNYYLLRLETPL